jgi:hypothetical protein
MVPLLVLAVSLHGWVQLRRSRLRNPVTPFFFEKNTLQLPKILSQTVHTAGSAQALMIFKMLLTAAGGGPLFAAQSGSS